MRLEETSNARIDVGPLPSFLRLVGLQDLCVIPGSAAVNLVFDPERHANGLNVAHGGVLCTLMDVVMGYSAYTWSEDIEAIVTIGQTVQFLGRVDGPVRAEGRVTHGGRSLLFCSAEIRNEAGILVASALGTFKRVRRAPGTPPKVTIAGGRRDV